MKWRDILALSSMWWATCAFTAQGWTPGLDWLLWLLVGLLCASVMGRRLTQRHFLHGFLVGLIGGLGLGLALSMPLFRPYIGSERDAPWQQRLAGQLELSPPVFFAILMFVCSLFSGLTLGLATSLAGRFMQRKPMVQAPAS